MEIQALKKYWQDCGETLFTLSSSRIDKTMVTAATFNFLTTCGLPYSAAPFLSFSELKEDTLLTPNQAFKIDFDDLTNYLMFGANGSGDPVCIDIKKENEIVYLNHDNYFERVFINADIIKFSFCLLKYKSFINSLLNINSADYTRRKFEDIELANLRTSFIQIDKNCLDDKSFWKPELDYLLYERDHE